MKGYTRTDIIRNVDIREELEVVSFKRHIKRKKRQDGKTLPNELRKSHQRG